MQIVTVEPSDPVIWPAGSTTEALFAAGSVVMVDCQDQFMDLRALPVNSGMEDATLIFLRCQVLLPDLVEPLARVEWTVDSSRSMPCDVCYSSPTLRT